MILLYIQFIFAMCVLASQCYWNTIKKELGNLFLKNQLIVTLLQCLSSELWRGNLLGVLFSKMGLGPRLLSPHRLGSSLCSLFLPCRSLRHLLDYDGNDVEETFMLNFSVMVYLDSIYQKWIIVLRGCLACCFALKPCQRPLPCNRTRQHYALGADSAETLRLTFSDGLNKPVLSRFIEETTC